MSASLDEAIMRYFGILEVARTGELNVRTTNPSPRLRSSDLFRAGSSAAAPEFRQFAIVTQTRMLVLLTERRSRSRRTTPLTAMCRYAYFSDSTEIAWVARGGSFRGSQNEPPPVLS